MFEALWNRTSVRHCIHVSDIYTVCMSPTSNGGCALRHFECGNTTDRMFDFYPGLPRLTCEYIVVNGEVLWVGRKQLMRRWYQVIQVTQECCLAVQ